MDYFLVFILSFILGVIAHAVMNRIWTTPRTRQETAIKLLAITRRLMESPDGSKETQHMMLHHVLSSVTRWEGYHQNTIQETVSELLEADKMLYLSEEGYDDCLAAVRELRGELLEAAGLQRGS